MANCKARGKQLDETSAGDVNKASRLLLLPQELLDIIFDLVYPEQEDAKFYSRAQWEHREKEARRMNFDHHLRPFPGAKVNGFMACKQYFENAARAWVANQHFTNDMSQAFHNLGYGTARERRDIVPPSLTDLTIRFYLPSFAESCSKNFPRLRKLSLYISCRDFEPAEPKFAWTHVLDNDDFAQLAESLCFDTLRGLLSLRLIPEVCYYAATPQQQQQWLDNVHGLENYLKPSITRAKDDSNTKRRSREVPPKPATGTSQSSSRLGRVANETISVSTDQSVPAQLDADSDRSQDSDVALPNNADTCGTKRISAVRNGKARKRVCSRRTKLYKRMVHRLTDVDSHRRAMIKEAARRIALNRQKPHKSTFDQLSVVSALSDVVIPSFGPMCPDVLESEPQLPIAPSDFVSEVAKLGFSDLHVLFELTPSDFEDRPAGRAGKTNIPTAAGPGSDRQCQDVDASELSRLIGAEQDMPPASSNDKVSCNDHSCREGAVSADLAQSSVFIGAELELTPFIPNDEMIGFTHAAGGRSPGAVTSSFTIEMNTTLLPARAQQKRKIDRSSPFTIHVGAEQETMPVIQTSRRESYSTGEETLREQRSTLQRSSLDAMQDLVQRESTLLAQALLASPESGNVEVEEVPASVEEAMKLLLKDSRSFLEWALDAKKEQLERRDAEAEADDSMCVAELDSASEVRSKSCDAEVDSTATVAGNITTIVAVAIVLMLFGGSFRESKGWRKPVGYEYSNTCVARMFGLAVCFSALAQRLRTSHAAATQAAPSPALLLTSLSAITFSTIIVVIKVMDTNVEAVRRAIASLFTNKPITLSQAMADLDVTTKPVEDNLFVSSAPTFCLPSYVLYNTAPLARTSKRVSRLPAGEAPQTREDLELCKHPAGYFVTVPGTGLCNRLCVSKAHCSILKKAPPVAQKAVTEVEVTMKAVGAARAEQIQTERSDTGESVGSDTNSLEDGYKSDSTLGREEGDSDGEAYSKYEVLRRTNDEDKLLGEDGDYSMYPDSSDESDED